MQTFQLTLLQIILLTQQRVLSALYVRFLFCLGLIIAGTSALLGQVNLTTKEIRNTDPHYVKKLEKHQRWHDHLGPIDEWIGSDSSGIYFKRRPNEFYPTSTLWAIDYYDHNYNLLSHIIVWTIRDHEMLDIVLLNGKLYAITRTWIKDSAYYLIKAHLIPDEGGALQPGVLLEQAKSELIQYRSQQILYNDWKWSTRFHLQSHSSRIVSVHAQKPMLNKDPILVVSIFDEGLKPVLRKEVAVTGNPMLSSPDFHAMNRTFIEQVVVDSLGQIWILGYALTTEKKSTPRAVWQKHDFTPDNRYFIVRLNPTNESCQLFYLDKPERSIDDCKLLIHPDNHLVYIGGSMHFAVSTQKMVHGTFLYALKAKDLSIANYTEQQMGSAIICDAGNILQKKMPNFYSKRAIWRGEMDRFYKVQYLQLTPDKQQVILALENTAICLNHELVNAGLMDYYYRLLYLEIYVNVYTTKGNPQQSYLIPKAQNCKLSPEDRTAMDIFGSFALNVQQNQLLIVYNEVVENMNPHKRYKQNMGKGHPFVYRFNLTNGSWKGSWLNMQELPMGTYLSPCFTQMHPHAKWPIYLQEFHLNPESPRFWGTFELAE